MKRIAFLVCLVVVVFAVLVWAQAQAKAPQPDPELKKLGIMVGHWTYEGEYEAGPGGPNGKAKGEEFIQWIFGGFFLQDLEHETGVLGDVRMALLYTYDPEKKHYVASGLMNDGSPASGIATVSGNTINWEGRIVLGGKENLMRNILVVAVDHMTMTQKAEVSADGKTWTPFFDALFTKVKPAPKTK
jgi:hypothetical protein